MKTIILTGELADKFGEHHEFEVENTYDVIAALSANCEGFKEYLYESAEKGISYQIITDRHPEGIENASELGEYIGGTLILTEIVGGSGAIGKAIAGVVLVGVGVATGNLQLGLLGASLVLQGASEFLTPKTSVKDNEEKEKNSSIDLNNPETSKDAPVPVLYGELRVKGFPILSAAVTTEIITE